MMTSGTFQKIDVTANESARRNNAGLFSANGTLSKKYKMTVPAMRAGMNQYRSTFAKAHLQDVSLLSS